MCGCTLELNQTRSTGERGTGHTSAMKSCGLYIGGEFVCCCFIFLSTSKVLEVNQSRSPGERASGHATITRTMTSCGCYN